MQESASSVVAFRRRQPIGKRIVAWSLGLSAVAGALAVLGTIGVVRIPWLTRDEASALEKRVTVLEEKVDALPDAVAEKVAAKMKGP
jgi:hypothetical protein